MLPLSQKKKAVEERKKEKKKEKIAKEKRELTDFPTAMANCGLWMEDEHVFDPDEVDEGDLDGS